MNTCVNNHELTPSNTYRAPSGRMSCRECKREAQRVSKARARASRPVRRPIDPALAEQLRAAHERGRG